MMSCNFCTRGESSLDKLAGESFQLQLRSAYDDNELIPQPLFANQQQLWEDQHTAFGTNLALRPALSKREWLQEEPSFTTTVQNNTVLDETESLIDDLLKTYYFTSFSGSGPVYPHDPKMPTPSNDLYKWLHSIDQFNQRQSGEHPAVIDSSDIRQADTTEHDHFPNSMDHISDSSVLMDNVSSNLELHDRLMEFKITYRPSSIDCSDLVSPRSKPVSVFECY